MTEKPDRPETPFIMERLLRESLRTEKAMEIATEDEFIAAVDEEDLIAQRKRPWPKIRKKWRRNWLSRLTRVPIVTSPWTWLPSRWI